MRFPQAEQLIRCGDGGVGVELLAEGLVMLLLLSSLLLSLLLSFRSLSDSHIYVNSATSFSPFVSYMICHPLLFLSHLS